MTLLVTAKPPPTPATEPKLRGRVGIKGIFDRAMTKADRVTLEQAIAILRRDW